MATSKELDILFPLPSRPPSVLSPSSPPGITDDSTQELVRLLKENHVRFHGFFNDKGFHNHLSHHLFAAYFLGATPKILQDAFELHASYQRDRFKSPASIDDNNWKEHLGDETYYDAYLTFFSSKLIKDGQEVTFQRYLFSPEANWGTKEGDDHPEMISRLLGGLVHPIIFLGHGVEFGQLGMVAEGLAQAATHTVTTSNLITREFLRESAESPSLASSLARKLNLKSSPSASPFAILQKILDDPRLNLKKPNEERFFKVVIAEHGSLIEEYAKLWEADTSTPDAVARRIEEISWVVSLIYGVGGYRKGQDFKADFFAMHLVTSSLFLPSFLVYLTSEAQRMLLRSFFAFVLGFWISQGTTKLDIAAFYDGTSANPPIPGPKPHPQDKTLAKDNLFPNAWYPLLQSTVMHPNEHLLKLVRALAHYSTLYGAFPKGRFSGEELRGAERLDGTLFLRAAWLSLEKTGWLREGLKDKVYWDFEGFYSE